MAGECRESLGRRKVRRPGGARQPHGRPDASFPSVFVTPPPSWPHRLLMPRNNPASSVHISTRLLSTPLAAQAKSSSTVSHITNDSCFRELFSPFCFSIYSCCSSEASTRVTHHSTEYQVWWVGQGTVEHGRVG